MSSAFKFLLFYQLTKYENMSILQNYCVFNTRVKFAIFWSTQAQKIGMNKIICGSLVNIPKYHAKINVKNTVVFQYPLV